MILEFKELLTKVVKSVVIDEECETVTIDVNKKIEI